MNVLRISMLFAAGSALALWQVPDAHAQGITDFEDEFEEPEYEEPEVEEPEVEEPEVEEPEVEEPEVEEPEVEEPEVEEPEVEEPEVEEPEVEEPETEDPEIEEPDAGSGETESDDISDDSGTEDENEDQDHLASESGEDASVSLAGDDWIADVAQARDPEFDEAGFPVERGELFALDLSDRARDILIEQGFTFVETTDLPALDASLTTLAVPPGRSVSEALAIARQADPSGIYDFGHFYGSPYDAAGRTDRRTGRAVPAGGATRGSLRVGLIDTQVRSAAIPANVTVTSRAFGSQEASSRSDHGTAVASILIGNGAGELVVANVFAGGGRDSFTSASEISRALSWMVESRVSVVNVSLAGPSNAVLDTLVHRASQRGMVIVAAAGNGGPASPPAYPAALPEVVAVTAVDSTRRVYRYANRGDYIRLATYGVQVPVTLGNGTTQYFTGTSFAAPRVATRIALCMAGGGTARDCITRLERSAVDLGTPGRDEIYGFGLVE